MVPSFLVESDSLFDEALDGQEVLANAVCAPLVSLVQVIFEEAQLLAYFPHIVCGLEDRHEFPEARDCSTAPLQVGEWAFHHPMRPEGIALRIHVRSVVFAWEIHCFNGAIDPGNAQCAHRLLLIGADALARALERGILYGGRADPDHVCAVPSNEPDEIDERLLVFRLPARSLCCSVRGSVAPGIVAAEPDNDQIGAFSPELAEKTSVLVCEPASSDTLLSRAEDAHAITSEDVPTACGVAFGAELPSQVVADSSCSVPMTVTYQHDLARPALFRRGAPSGG